MSATDDLQELGWLPAGELAQRLGTYNRWIFRAVGKLGIESEPRPYNGGTLPCYPPGTLEQLRAEQEQQRQWHEANQPLSTQELADKLGRSYGWVDKNLAELGIKPLRYEKRGSFNTALYPPRSLTRLRQLLPPPSDHWYNLGQLVDQTGYKRDRIQSLLRHAGIHSERRVSVETGHVRWFYPPETLEWLRRHPPVPPAGDWLTKQAITDLLGKSYSWTTCRLQQPRFRQLAQLRLDDREVTRLHYPPRVLEALRQELAAQGHYPSADGWLVLSTLSRKVGRSSVWVSGRLTQWKVSPELRLDGKNRVKDHYQPDLVPKLQHLAQQEANRKPGNWLTVAQIAQRLGVPREAVLDRLTAIPHRSSWRLAPGPRRLVLHYSPATVAKLRQSFKEHPYDRLISAKPYLRLLQDFKLTHGLTYQQLDHLLWPSSSRQMMDHRRIRQSLADRIERLAYLPEEAIDKARLSQSDWLITKLQELAAELGRTPAYPDLRVATGFNWNELYRHWPTINHALRAAGLTPA